MSLLEKYLEGKNKLHAKFDEINEARDKQLDAAGGEFLSNFKEMVANASEEEFHEFMLKSGKQLDEVERMAALCARLESYRKRSSDKSDEDNANDEHKRGVHVMVVELD